MHIYQHLILVATLLVSMQGTFAQPPAQITAAEARLAKEIGEAKRLAEALETAANKVDKEFWIGTMYNEVDLPEHTCYSLGMLLGLDTNVRKLRFDRRMRSARTADEANELRIRAQSLDNFASAASAALKESEKKRSIAWNLDCAEKYGIVHHQNGASTFYEITNGGRGIEILARLYPFEGSDSWAAID